VLPLAGVELFTRQGGLWFRHGSKLPCSDVPDDRDAVPLSSFLLPSAVIPAEPAGAAPPVRLTLVRDNKPRPSTALLVSLDELVRWADSATSHRLAELKGARNGGRVLLLGQRLPPLTGERWWGEGLLMPLGFRPEPDLPESILRQALRLPEDAVGLLSDGGLEVVASDAFGTVTRAGIRLAAREGRA
jgi:hypothetical protein